MFPLRPISIFLVLCVGVYALLMWPWPGVREAHRKAFRACGNVAFQKLPNGGSVAFEAKSSRDHSLDTSMILKKTKPFHAQLPLGITTSYLAYRPAAFLMALVMASPVRWPRRFWALFWGLVFVHLFILFRVGLIVFNTFVNGEALITIYSLGSAGKFTLFAARNIFARAGAMDYIAPMFVWLLVTFRRGDLDAILRRSTQPAVPSGVERE